MIISKYVFVRCCEISTKIPPTKLIYDCSLTPKYEISISQQALVLSIL